MAYTPKYISKSDIPVQIPDDYTESEKLDAIQLAEVTLEIDLNNGQTINNVKEYHKAALKQKATCELAKGSEHPDDAALGDLDDTGTTKFEYAIQAFCDNYESIVDGIQTHIDSEQTGPYTYTTSPSEDWKDWEDWETDIDIEFDELVDTLD